MRNKTRQKGLCNFLKKVQKEFEQHLIKQIEQNIITEWPNTNTFIRIKGKIEYIFKQRNK